MRVLLSLYLLEKCHNILRQVILCPNFRNYSKGHHYSALPADTFEGKIITKTRILDKGACRGPVKYGGMYIATMLPGE